MAWCLTSRLSQDKLPTCGPPAQLTFRSPHPHWTPSLSSWYPELTLRIGGRDVQESDASVGEGAVITGCDMLPLRGCGWHHRPAGLRACGFGPGRGRDLLHRRVQPWSGVVSQPAVGCGCSRAGPHRPHRQGSQGASVSEGQLQSGLIGALVNSGKCGPRSLGGKRDVESSEVAVDPELEDPPSSTAPPVSCLWVQGTRADWDLVLPATRLSTQGHFLQGHGIKSPLCSFRLSSSSPPTNAF